MNVFAIDLSSYKINHFYFLEQKPNLIINGFFSKIIYTDYDYTINSMYFYIPDNLRCSDAIGKLETQILQQYTKHTNTNKEFVIVLHNSNRLLLLKSLTFKNLLKISGVWESDTHIGLTFKWVDGFTCQG